MPGMAEQYFSLLSGEEIESAQLVAHGNKKFYRASTYDLSVGDIIPAIVDGDGADNSKYTLPPGGTVRVVSHETLKLPDGITGHVLLKNELCRKGILAINIGVVDPGFEGPLSSTLINFGRADFVVKKGASFLRVSFHRCPPSPKARDSARYTREAYVDKVREEGLAYSAQTFLNVDVTVEKAAQKAFGKFKQALLVWAAMAAVVLTLIAVLAPLGASYVDRALSSRNEREHEMEQRLEQKYESRLKALSDRIEVMERNESGDERSDQNSKKRP
jgi:deoxycytidine triphosphate deaminase